MQGKVVVIVAAAGGGGGGGGGGCGGGGGGFGSPQLQLREVDFGGRRRDDPLLHGRDGVRKKKVGLGYCQR